MDFETFACSQHRRLVASLTLYCGDRWVAEELAQDALVRARERWGHVAEMAEPAAWLYRVAINLANSWVRRRRAERRALARVGSGSDSEEPVSADAIAVRTAVAQLPARPRAAIICRYFLELSVAETATAMNLRPGSVKSATHRGLTALRRNFEFSDAEKIHDIS